LPVCLWVSLAAASPAFAAPQEAKSLSAAELTYIRVLKGSVPEYLSITVNADGQGSYEGRKLGETATPRPFQLSLATSQRLFELAADLNNFKDIQLESHKKVANLGLKTFIYRRGGEKNQVQFNYTLQREAQELSDLFEKIAGVEEHIKALEFAIKYDPLGLPRELLQIQIDLQERALVDPELMVPSLEQIVSNPRFLHLAQVRAQNILKTVRDGE
jgi:hypothetical protein